MSSILDPFRRYGLPGVFQRALSDPRVMYRYLFEDNQGRVLPKRQFERPIAPTEIAEFVRLLKIPVSREEIHDIWLDLCDNRTLRSEIASSFRSTKAGPGKFYHNWRDILYVLIRAIRPARVVETGVRGGLSSAYLLSGLACEDHGQLLSIDIGDTSLLPQDLDSPEIGWMVPHRLRSRWDLRIADSKVELPTVVNQEVDMLFSDVPNRFLQDELSIAAEQMRPGSMIITCCPRNSDAIDVWKEFADESLTATASVTRWESGEAGSDLHAGVLADRS